MPPTIPTIQIGVPTTLAQDVVYAMPVRKTIGFVLPVGSDLEVSDTTAFSTAVNVVPSAEGKFETAAPFMRNHSAASALVLLKAD